MREIDRERAKWTRRQFLAAGGLAMGGAVIAGCTSNTGQESGGSGPGLKEVKGKEYAELEPSPSKEDLVGGPQWKPPDLSGEQITMWGLNYAPHVDRYKRLADEFKKLTGATVEVQPQDDPGTKMLTAMAGGNVPDVLCYLGRASGTFVGQKGILSIDDSVLNPLQINAEKWWIPEGIQSFQYPDGKHYGVPIESSPMLTVTCRTDLIQEAGADAQALWPGSVSESEWPDKGVWFENYDNLFSLAEKVQQKKNGKVKVWGLNSQGWEHTTLTSIMRGLGTFWWDQENQRFNLDSDACVKAIELLVTIPYQKGIEARLGVGSSINAFLARQVALADPNSSTAGEAGKIDIPAENVVLPPAVEGQEPLLVGEGGWGFEVPAQAKNQEVGLEFLKFMCTYEAKFIWSQIYGGMTPACKALVNSKIYQGDDPLKRGLRRELLALQNTVYMGHGFDPQMVTGDTNLFTRVMDSVREGKLKPKEASKQLQQQATDQTRRQA